MLLRFIKAHKTIFLLLYYLMYLPWFTLLQQRTGSYTVIHCTLDEMIPFVEAFIIPYLLWFLYIPAVQIYLFFKEPEYFLRCCITMYAGMTLALLTYTVFPNGQDLRPVVSELGRSNIFIDGMQKLWSSDPAINVCPSVHVLNSLAVHYALLKAPSMKDHPIVRYASLILIIFIILSTMFLKQHSVIDVIAAIAISVPLYFLAFKPEYPRLRHLFHV